MAERLLRLTVISAQQVVQLVVDSHNYMAIACIDGTATADHSVLPQHHLLVQPQNIFRRLRDNQTTSAPCAIWCSVREL